MRLHAGAGLRVERAERLIHQKNTRLIGERAAATRIRARSRVALELLLVGAALATLSVHVTTASLEHPSARVSSPLSVGTGATDLAEQNARMLELAAREQQLSQALLGAEQTLEARRERSLSAVRVLELEQELRHVRAMQAWLEERLVREWGAARNMELAKGFEPPTR